MTRAIALAAHYFNFDNDYHYNNIRQAILFSFTMSDAPQQLPVTIITGFLGSGKTTLLNQILQNDLDRKVAVLVNEFGDINIDSQLLVSYDDDMVELSNGCILLHH